VERDEGDGEEGYGGLVGGWGGRFFSGSSTFDFAASSTHTDHTLPIACITGLMVSRALVNCGCTPLRRERLRASFSFRRRVFAATLGDHHPLKHASHRHTITPVLLHYHPHHYLSTIYLPSLARVCSSFTRASRTIFMDGSFAFLGYAYSTNHFVRVCSNFHSCDIFLPIFICLPRPFACFGSRRWKCDISVA
jgi:hypothetical protein